MPRRVFQRLLLESPTPERCLEAYYLQRTPFETIAERKLRQRQLTYDGNVKVTGRDLRERATAAPMPVQGRIRRRTAGIRRQARTPLEDIGVKSGRGENSVLTKDILFGMNLLTLLGFLVMAASHCAAPGMPACL